MFSDDSPQRELLSETTLENGLNYDKKGVAGMTTPSTTDLVFLLSVPEVMEYESLLMLDDPDTEFWLRSQGGDNTRGVFPVFSENAEVTFNGSTEVAKAKGIRPAIMVDMDKLQALYADGCSLLHAGNFEAAAESLKYTELWNDILEALYEENKMERSDTPVIRFLLDNMNEDGIAEIRSNALFTDILPEVQSGDIVRFGKEVVKKSNSTVFEGDTPGSIVSKVTDTAMNLSAKQNLLIRQSASDNADVLWAAAKGDPLIFIERGANDWIRVQSENGVVGWVHEDFLQYGKIVESVDMKTLDTGDFFYYGSYEQDGTGSQEIEWQVLTAEKDRILVVSRYGLETMPYHDTAVNVTWETSSLRSWLNGTFLNTAFSDEEKSHIAEVTHGSAANPDHKTPGGDETTDRIFILDLNEVQRYMVLNADRFCAPTEHARNNGAYSDYYVYRTYWWLRTPGVSGNTAVYVNQAGDTYVYGKYVNDGTVTVRPAFWLDVD